MTDKQYDNTNTFVLFKNEQGDNPKRPQYRGTLNVKGVEFNISAWVRESKQTGKKFMSGTVEPKQDAKPKPQKINEQNWDTADLNDELPPF